jgi:hypothetical protein
MKQKYKVTVQYRSVRAVTVVASNEAEATEKASKRIERSGNEVIVCAVRRPVDQPN